MLVLCVNRLILFSIFSAQGINFFYSHYFPLLFLLCVLLFLLLLLLLVRRQLLLLALLVLALLQLSVLVLALVLVLVRHCFFSSFSGSTIVTLSGKYASGGMILTRTPMMPGFSWTGASAVFMALSAGSPTIGKWPAEFFEACSFSGEFAADHDFAPSAPASITWLSAQKPARLKCTPRSRAEATRFATTWALNSGTSISES